MAGLIGVLGGSDPRALVERAAEPLLRRPWHELHLASPEADVALAFAGERGAVETDAVTGVTVAFDGELFLDDGVRSEREAARLLLRLYLDDRADLEPPQGSFAAAFWDPRDSTFTLVNDRHGRRPVWMARIDQVLVIASELKALIAAGLPPKIDPQGWAEFLAYEYVLLEHPYLADTRLLPAATTLVIERDGTEHLRRRWVYRLEPEPDADERELVHEFGRLLDLAIARRLTPDTALSLSGGLDSRSLASILRVRAPDTVALTWGAPASHDLELGSRIAAVAGFPHRRSHFQRGYIARAAEESVWLTEGHARCFHVHLREARQLRASDGARSILISIGGDHLVRTIGGALETGGELTEPLAFHHSRAGCISDALLEEVLSPEFASELRGRARDSMIASLGTEEGPPLARIRQLVSKCQQRKIWSQAELFADNLAARDPFDDHDLVDFCRRMPERFRRGGRLQRAYLRQFPDLARVPNARDGLPLRLSGAPRRLAAFSVRAGDGIRRRMGLDLDRGIGEYASDLRHGRLLDVLLEPRTLERGQLQEGAVRRLVEETLTRRAKHTRALGVLLTFELFQRQFVDGDGYAPADVSDPSAETVAA